MQDNYDRTVADKSNIFPGKININQNLFLIESDDDNC